MSVGLLLKAKILPGWLDRVKPKDLPKVLEEMRNWVLDYSKDLHPTAYIGTSEERPTLFCRLHPAAEDVELSFVNANEFTVRSNTSSVGPGYHVFVCEMLRALGTRFNAEWEPETADFADEAHYFFTGDQGNVFAEMDVWLRTLASMFFDGTIDEEGSVQLALSLDVSFSSEERALTPTGPRNTDWLRKVAEDPKSGRDFFPWWTPGFGADYFLGRALVRIWADVRWRTPVNANETEILSEVADCLTSAYKLDPNAIYPWPEWAEVLRLLRRTGSEYEFVSRKSAGRPGALGYRRQDVTALLPGHWRITVPGSFSDFQPDEQDNYFAFDPPREVWVTSYRFRGDIERSWTEARSDMLKEAPQLVFEDDELLRWGEIKTKEVDGAPYFLLQGQHVIRGQRAVTTIVFSKPEEEAWAIKVWESLTPPKS